SRRDLARSIPFEQTVVTGRNRARVEMLPREGARALRLPRPALRVGVTADRRDRAVHPRADESLWIDEIGAAPVPDRRDGPARHPLRDGVVRAFEIARREHHTDTGEPVRNVVTVRIEHDRTVRDRPLERFEEALVVRPLFRAAPQPVVLARVASLDPE